MGIKLMIKECFELDTDYQSQFLGKEVFPEVHYNKVKVLERTINKVHYKDIYLLEPQHFYYVTFDKEEVLQKTDSIKINHHVFLNGLLTVFDKNKLFLYNASQNIVYLQKGVCIAEVSFNG